MEKVMLFFLRLYGQNHGESVAAMHYIKKAAGIKNCILAIMAQSE